MKRGRTFTARDDRAAPPVASRDNALNRDPGPMMFIPQAQEADAVNALNVRISPIAWVVRTRADAPAVRRMVILHGMRLAIVGVVIGIVGAYCLTRFIASFLFGVKPLDPVAFAVIPLLLGGVAFLAVWVPAQRASRVDPVIALRGQ